MPTLILRFPGRRYHATPWGHHVNEGLIEWPPSPWRLLRALLSTGYTTLGWSGDMGKPMECSPPVEARSLILKLAGVLPRYRLPVGAGAHSRHYMPLAALKAPGAKADTSFVLAHQVNGSPIVHGYKEDTTLVFDTWAQVDEGEIAVTWDVELTDAETELLAQLANRLGYLGRSESWVIARLVETEEPLPESNCFPEIGFANPGPGWEQVPLMAPSIPTDYAQWREHALSTALADLPEVDANKKKLTKDEKKTIEQRRKAEAPYPIDLIACLQAPTNWLREHGWSQPPGSRRVFYWRKSDALEAGAPKPRLRAISAPSVEAMLLSMATASGNDHALPPITRTLPQAEMLHKHLGHALKRLDLGHSRVLSGCDEQENRLAGRHTHAHILPLDLDGDGHLEHILIWAPMGLDAQAQAAIRAVRQTFTKGGVGALKLALEAVGDLADLRRLPGKYGDGLRTLLGPENGATEWVTRTPFVPPRYLKPRGNNSLEGQITAELASRGRLEPVEVRRLDPWEDETRIVRLRGPSECAAGQEPEQRDECWLRFRHFVRSRRSGPPAPIDCGFPLSVRLAEPVSGPLCLGYGSHFGLGMFGPT